ncbi:MAG TPA: glycosyltransferase family 2 protein [Candidatus Cybelea sp.]|nr:glycosyltransferase family 2 protein [Candidatus Cybelea sp.]
MNERAETRVTAVIVAYNSARVIERCLGALQDVDRVVLVDNASRDDTIACARRAHPNVDIAANDRNLGFGAAANIGFGMVRSEFAFLLNPDSVLRPGAISELIAAADAFPEAGALGPRLRNPSGRIERSHDAWLFAREGMPHRRDAEPEVEGPCCAGYLSGAALFLRMQAVQAIGGFDPALFLYFEDDDLCRSLKEAGFSAIVVPSAEADHVGGGSVAPELGSERRKYFHMGWSRLYLEAKHRGKGRAMREGWRRAARYSAKALGYMLIGQAHKARRDAALLSGTLAFMRGRPASPAN